MRCMNLTHFSANKINIELSTTFITEMIERCCCHHFRSCYCCSLSVQLVLCLTFSIRLRGEDVTLYKLLIQQKLYSYYMHSKSHSLCLSRLCAKLSMKLLFKWILICMQVYIVIYRFKIHRKETRRLLKRDWSKM